jgi:palmitoyltransferase
LISLYQALFALFWPVKVKVFDLFQTRNLKNFDDFLLFGAFSLNFLLTVMISMFFRFHLRLILTNSTTIENMDKKNTVKDTYTKGTANNWFQVFGKNKWLWMLPMTGVSGKPIGDGVIWTQENFHNVESEVPENENDIRKSMTLSGTGSLAQQLAKDNGRIGSPPIGPGKGSFDVMRRDEAGTKPGSIDSNVFSKN